MYNKYTAIFISTRWQSTEQVSPQLTTSSTRCTWEMYRSHSSHL